MSLPIMLFAFEALAQVSADRVVTLWTTMQTNPPAITLNWSAFHQPNSYMIQRKSLLSTGWTTLATLTNPPTLSFADSNVLAGVGYEYKVTRLYAGTNAWGFLYAGIDLPAVQERGTLVLAIESNAASLLAPELARFELDLAGDGWKTARILVPWKNWNDPGWAVAVTNLKSQIVSLYTNDPSRVKAVLLFGHVPVPYSGDCCPDGHYESHWGAWPADAYYGDMSNVWYDTITSTSNHGARLNNLPGDGKFNPTDYTEYTNNLMVGRVDLSAMPAFAQSEMELLRQYLAKDHHYRMGVLPTQARGLIHDNFGYFGGEAFAQNGIRDYNTFYGPSNVIAVGAYNWFPTLRTNRYQFAYGCGGGNFTSAGGVGTTADFAAGPVRAVFTMLFGSKFGDWDYPNSFLRAPLASMPSVLTCVWAGRPVWCSHPMDMGEPIGTVYRMLQGPLYEDYADMTPYPLAGVYTAIMGDPTLRLRYPDPPRHLSATATVSQVVLTWTPAADPGILGYVVSRSDEGTMSFSNLFNGFLPGTAYTDSVARATGVLYRIRSVKKEIVRSGSYTNLGQGVYLRVGADNHVNRPPVVTHMGIATIVNRPVAVPLSGSDPDGDPAFVSLVDWPFSGSLTGTPAHLVYLPASGFTGTVQFAYEASDGVADSATGVVSITVAPIQTSRGTSIDWLIRTIGYTNDYEKADQEDPDQDGQPTWSEYRAGTDPLNSASVFAFLALSLAGSSNELVWYGTTNSGVTAPFSVARGTNWTNLPWPVAVSNLARHPSGTNTWWDTNIVPSAFYRVFIP
jgi:hypothetical protein